MQCDQLGAIVVIQVRNDKGLNEGIDTESVERN